MIAAVLTAISPGNTERYRRRKHCVAVTDGGVFGAQLELTPDAHLAVPQAFLSQI